MPESPEVQAAVERLALALGLAILVEDADYRPRWWSAQGEVDGLRASTILQRTVDPAADRLVRRHGVATSRAPVRIPGAPQLGMLPRWCVPLRAGAALHGFLWVIDPEGRIGEPELAELTACGDLACGVLAREARHAAVRGTRRAALLAMLRDGRDDDAARELLAGEGLPADTRVGVDDAATAGTRWHLGDGLSAVPHPPPGAVLLGGAPLPAADLAVAVERARITRRVLAAGGRLTAPSWDALGAWRLVAAAPMSIAPGELHPAFSRVAEDPALLRTARALVEAGADVAAAAAALHVHRTTLYYRLERLATVHGLDLRDPRSRDDFAQALRLHDYRRHAPSTPVE